MIGFLLFLLSQAAPRQNLAQTEGNILKGYMTAFGYTTQASLSSATKIPATRISLVTRGLDTLRDREMDSLTAIFSRRFALTMDEGVFVRLSNSRLRVYPRPIPASFPVKGMADGRHDPTLTPPGYRFRVLNHGLTLPTRVIIRFHAATPSFDNTPLFVRRLGPNDLALYWDTLGTKPVVTTANGFGGTMQRTP